MHCKEYIILPKRFLIETITSINNKLPNEKIQKKKFLIFKKSCMKIFFITFFLLLTTTFLYSQDLFDKNGDGKIDNGFCGYADVNGDGIPNILKSRLLMLKIR